ncbi:MAG: hypothetical protein ABIN80_05670 [Dyadobacter sp.]|uniref:hypothetical protein n=1 Tax=Dyadobacter sp. TaxID=1914288 RepID=UPI003265DA96
MKLNSASGFGKISLLFGTGVALDCLAHSISSLPADATLFGCPNEIIAGVLTIGTDVVASGVFEGWQKVLERLKKEPESPLEQAIIQAYRKTINEIRNEIIEEYKLKKQSSSWIFNHLFLSNSLDQEIIDELDEMFFHPLLLKLTDEYSISEMLEKNAQLKPDEYLLKIIEITTPRFYQTEDKLLHEFTNSILGKFKRLFKKNIITELESSEKAQNAYLTHLLETILLRVNEIYEKQGEKLNVALNILLDFKSETRVSSDIIKKGFSDIRLSIGLMLSRIDDVDKKLAGIVSLLTNVSITKEIYVEKIVYVEAYLQDIEGVTQKWEDALGNEEIMFNFLEMLSSKFDKAKFSAAEELEQAYNLIYLRAENRSVSSKFGILSRLRVTLYAQLLLYKKDLTDEICHAIIQNALTKTPTNCYGDLVEYVHDFAICNNNNRQLWASILHYQIGSSLSIGKSNMYFDSLSNHSFRDFDLYQEPYYDKIVQGFQSSILLERLVSAMIFTLWAANDQVLTVDFVNYFKLMDYLEDLLTGNSAEKAVAIYAYSHIFSSGNIDIRNPSECRDKDKIALIKMLDNPHIPLISITALITTVGRIYRTEYI